MKRRMKNILNACPIVRIERRELEIDRQFTFIFITYPGAGIFSGSKSSSRLAVIRSETLQLTPAAQPDVSRLIRSETRRIISETKRVDRRGRDCRDIWIRFAVIRRLRPGKNPSTGGSWNQRGWPIVVATDRYRTLLDNQSYRSSVYVCVYI